MKTLFTKTAVLLSIYGLCALNAHARIDTVLVQDNAFFPGSLTVCKGDTLRFVYAAGAASTHNVHITAPLDSVSADLATTGNIFEFAPDSQGVYSYQCDYHMGMKGSFTVNDVPSVDLGPDAEPCGTSLLLDAGASNSTYAWSTGASTQSITVNASGNYWVVAYNACGSSTSDKNVTFYPAMPVVNLGPDVTVCGGIMLSTGVSPASKYKYKWSTNATTSAITVSASGTYIITVSDTILLSPCEKKDTIKVTVTGKNPLMEGMEKPAFPPAGWTPVNPDNKNTWKKTSNAAKTGSACMVMENHNYPAIGQKDEMISPLLCDLSNSPKLTFQVAYRLYSNPASASAGSDTLIVQFSGDSGLTWTTVYKKYGASGTNQLATTTPSFSTEPFVPTANQWRMEMIALSPASKAFVKFINVNGYENQLYIDDINISSGVGIDEINEYNYFSVFPNPSAGEFTIQMTEHTGVSEGTLAVYNLYGEKIHSALMNEERKTIDLSNQPDGIYLIELRMENTKGVNKIIISK